jgi:hypothetical protein
MQNQKIRFTYITGKLSATLIIPLELAKKNGLNTPSDVIVEETDDGILIKKRSDEV